MTKYPAARPSSLDPPAGPAEYPVGMCSPATAACSCGQHRALRRARHEVRGQRDLALAVQALNARRPGRRQDPDDFAERHRAAPGRKHRQPLQAIEVAAERLARPQRDVVLILADVERRHVLSANHRVQRLRDVLHAHAEIGGALPIDFDAEFRLADDERGVGVGELGNGSSSCPAAPPSTRRASRGPDLKSNTEFRRRRRRRPRRRSCADCPGNCRSSRARPDDHVVLRRRFAHRARTSFT